MKIIFVINRGMRKLCTNCFYQHLKVNFKRSSGLTMSDGLCLKNPSSQVNNMVDGSKSLRKRTNKRPSFEITTKPNNKNIIKKRLRLIKLVLKLDL